MTNNSAPRINMSDIKSPQVHYLNDSDAFDAAMQGMARYAENNFGQRQKIEYAKLAMAAQDAFREVQDFISADRGKRHLATLASRDSCDEKAYLPVPAVPAVPAPIVFGKCQACTFVNHPDCKWCEMCSTELAGYQ